MGLNGKTICFVAGTVGIGGAEQQLFYILRELVYLGTSIHLIVLNNDEDGLKRFQTLPITIHILSVRNPISKIFALTRLIRNIKPDLLQSQHFYVNFFVGIVGKLLKIPSIGACRSSLASEMAGTGKVSTIALNLPDYIIANSKEAFQEILNLRKKNVDTIFYLPNCIDVSAFKPSAANSSYSEKFNVLTIARYTQVKRIDKVIELAKSALKLHPHLQFNIIGYGNLENELMALAENSGVLNKNLKFLGKMNPKTELSASNAFLLTSDHEGTPNVIMEAMASCLPIFTTSVGNINILLQDTNNYIVEPNDYLNILEGIVQLSGDSDRAIRIGNENRIFIENLNGGKVLRENLTNIYNRI
ncbi:MAG: glycosyltransferase family 4 protein [Bacteroidota bacterium]|nr:glycosyltransferase family 4 protein [Bacteroidota bacterium]